MTTKRYRIVVSPLFKKQFSKLDVSIQRLVAKYIKNNLDGISDPRIKGKALKGNKGGLCKYRIIDYRLICEINDKEIVILVINIGHRKEIYQK